MNGRVGARESRGTSICRQEGATITKKQERTTNKQKETARDPANGVGGVEEIGRTGGGSAVDQVNKSSGACDQTILESSAAISTGGPLISATASA